MNVDPETRAVQRLRAAGVLGAIYGDARVQMVIPHCVRAHTGNVLSEATVDKWRGAAVAPTGDFSDTFFRSHVTPFGKGSSFPSGHAAAAFSIATVLADRYRRHRWVPFVAYGVAGLISFSRVPDSAHFPSDVFLGSALGFTIAHFVVMRRHRFNN